MKQKKNIYLYSAYLLIVVILLLVPTRAHALTILPVRLEISGNPGQVVTHDMTLINEQNVPMTFYSSFMNFEAQGDTGSPTFVEAHDDLGTWMSTNQSVLLGPNETKNVTVSISIPHDAAPGGHFGAVFWGTTPNTENQGGQVAVSAKTGMLVLLSVNGDVKEGGGLTDFSTIDHAFWYSSLPVSFIYHFRNDGGDRIKPSGQIVIRDTVFLPSKRLSANPVEGNILPNSTRKFQVDWGPTDEAQVNAYKESGFFGHLKYQWQHFALGLYSAHMNLAYGTKGETATASAYFFVFPWQLVLTLIIGIIIVIWGGKTILVRYNNYVIRRAQSLIQK